MFANPTKGIAIMVTPDQIIAAARSLAALDGKDPDATTSRDPNSVAPLTWESYLPEVRRLAAILSAFEEAGAAAAKAPKKASSA